MLPRRVYPPLSISCLPGFDPDSIIVSTRRHMDLAKLIPRTVRTCFDNLAVSRGCLVLTHHAPFARGASSSSNRRTFLSPTPPTPPPPPPHIPGVPPMPSRAAPVPAGAAASSGREHQWAHAAAVSHGVLPPWGVCICHPTVLQVPGPGDLPTSSGEPCVCCTVRGELLGFYSHSLPSCHNVCVNGVGFRPGHESRPQASSVGS